MISFSSIIESYRKMIYKAFVVIIDQNLEHEALAESNFKIYTNYECNYELILKILSYYNVIAEIFLGKKKYIEKIKLITIN